MEIIKYREKAGAPWQDLPAIKGEPGHTPVLGVDYWTDVEKDALIEEIAGKYVTHEELDQAGYASINTFNSLANELREEIPAGMDEDFMDATDTLNGFHGVISKGDIPVGTSKHKLENYGADTFPRATNTNGLIKVLKLKLPCMLSLPYGAETYSYKITLRQLVYDLGVVAENYRTSTGGTGSSQGYYIYYVDDGYEQFISINTSMDDYFSLKGNAVYFMVDGKFHVCENAENYHKILPYYNRIWYDNSISGLESTDIPAAINELASMVNNIEGGSGGSSADLTNYYTKTETDTQITTKIQDSMPDLAGYATEKYVDDAIAGVSAPEVDLPVQSGTGEGSIMTPNATGASGSNSIALGSSANAAGPSGIAMGNLAEAKNTYAVGIGYKAKANYTSSIAIGRDVTADAVHQFVAGCYNEADTGARFIIGNGTSATEKKNAMLVYEDNQVYFPGSVVIGESKDEIATKAYVESLIPPSGEEVSY